MTDQLRNEIVRLRADLLKLTKRRTEFINVLDFYIGDIRLRLDAAERMLTTYTASLAPGDPESSSEPSEHTRELLRRASKPVLTQADVEAVTIPHALRGQPLRMASKKANIIRATKAYLLARGSARRSEIVEFLQELGIIGSEKNSLLYVSVTLSNAREIFSTDGSLWSIRSETEDRPLTSENARS